VNVLAILALVVIITAVAAVVSAPLRRPRSGPATAPDSRAELEEMRLAKYREIRDAELDHRTGKLSRPDWEALDAQLRAEAMEILRRLDEAGA
jgi:hypothetical protein